MLSAHRIIFIAITFPLLSSCAFGLFHYENTLEGVVVDVETNAPIPGALVLANWAKHADYPHFNPLTDQYKIIEKYTNNNGEFILPWWFKFVPHMGYLDPAALLVYKQGYEAVYITEYDHSLYSRTDFIQEIGSPKHVEFSHLNYSSGVSPVIKLRKLTAVPHNYPKDIRFVNKKINEMFDYWRHDCKWAQITDTLIMVHKDLPLADKNKSLASEIIRNMEYWYDEIDRSCKDPLVVFNELHIDK